MSELFVILVGTVLVNNFVLTRFLGLCPFLGVSRNLEAATGMSFETYRYPLGHVDPSEEVRWFPAPPGEGARHASP